uniref:Reverse transcriptase domain-containing protein n=1 Tax=Nothobranchius furzeri TaxID=105023 RepID=A0A8C6LZC6_NOTFU
MEKQRPNKRTLDWLTEGCERCKEKVLCQHNRLKLSECWDTFKTVDFILNVNEPLAIEYTTESCNNFLDFFVDKVRVTRASIPPRKHAPSADLCVPKALEGFQPLTLAELVDLVMRLKPTGAVTYVLPARLLTEVFSVVGDHVLQIVNSSLISGEVPTPLKQAVVRPLLKKSGLDPAILSNYRPLSTLPFISKIIERAVFIQLMSFLQEWEIGEVFQSGFKPFHSTESALLKVLDDILLANDSGDAVVLVLLDLTSAFDTVDCILINRLEWSVGITGQALKWIRSYLTGRSFCVRLGDCSSDLAELPWGVSQGSILAPLFFSLYLLPQGELFRKHGVSFHLYADDCQIIFPFRRGGLCTIQPLLDCLEDIKLWLAQNFLCFNEHKTEVILFTPPKTLGGAQGLDFSTLAPHQKAVVTNLGAKLDAELRFDAQVNGIVRSCFFHLRRIAKIKPFSVT